MRVSNKKNGVDAKRLVVFRVAFSSMRKQMDKKTLFVLFVIASLSLFPAQFLPIVDCSCLFSIPPFSELLLAVKPRARISRYNQCRNSQYPPAYSNCCEWPRRGKKGRCADGSGEAKMPIKDSRRWK